MDIKIMDNNEWLAFLHQLHCKIRNAKGLKLTGMAALNEINNFLLLRFAEKYVDKEELDEKCKFSYLYETFASNKKIAEDKKKKHNENTNAFLLWRAIYDLNAESPCAMKLLTTNDFFRKYMYTDVIRSTAYVSKVDVKETVQDIINYIHKTLKNVKLDYDFFDNFGSAYERFKTDAAANSGKDTGQHFTPISVKKFIMDEIKPQYNESIYEPCAGSGGFIHTAYSYVYNHDKEHANEFKKSIYANECNPEIVKPLMINMLLHRIPIEHIEEQDSLSNENCKDYFEKFDIITTNPPFGMKMTIDPSVYLDDYWTPIQNGRKVMSDSSGQFIMHIYNSLKDGGRTGFVIDRGILNNGTGEGNTKWQGKLREFLFNNVNVYKIILLPSGIFTYTNFATAIIFFVKGTKTKTVKIYDGKFKDVKRKEGLIIDEEKPLKIFTYKELKENDYSLRIEHDVEDVSDIGYIALGKVIKFEFGTRITKKEILENNDENDNIYPVFGGGGVSFHTNTFNRNGYNILVSRFGVSPHCVRIINEKIFLNDSGMSVKIIDKTKNSHQFMGYYLQINERMIFKYAFGSGQKNMASKDVLEKFMIPDIPLDKQEKIVEFLDEQFKKHDINKLPAIVKDVPIFELLIAGRYDDFASALQLIYRKIEVDEMTEKFENDKKAIFRWMVNGTKCKEVKLGDILKKGSSGKTNSSEISDTGEYKFYSASANNPSGSHNDYDFEGNDYFIFAKSGGNRDLKIGITIGMGKFWRVSGKTAGNVATIKFTNEYDGLSNDYLDYYLKCILFDIQRLAKYATGNGNINVPEMLETINIKIPYEKIQSNIMKKMTELEPHIITNKIYSSELQTHIDMMFNSMKKMGK